MSIPDIVTTSFDTNATPDLAVYRAVHAAVRAAPHRLERAAAAVAPSDPQRSAAIRRYWTGVASEIVVHHRVEDEIVFPAVGAKAPNAAVFDRTAHEHHHLDVLLSRCDDALRRLDRPGGAAGAGRAFADLAASMDEHLDFEDREVLPLIERLFDPEEYRALEGQANRAVGIGKQAAFTVPFVLSYADDAERERLLAAAPAAFRVIYRLTRRRHDRLVDAALGSSDA